MIDASDAVFDELRVWRDLDGDGATDAGELFALSDIGIQSISLAAAAPVDPIDIGGNTIAAEAVVTMTDGSTRMAGDAVLDISHIDTRYITDTTVNAAAEALPELRDFRARAAKSTPIPGRVGVAFVVATNDNQRIDREVA